MFGLYKNNFRLLMKDELHLTIRGQAERFQYFMQLSGEVFRQVASRVTSRVHIHGQAYFIKQHLGVGWLEIIKNLLSFKKPILSARNEMLALQKLEAHGILTTPLVAYGEQGSNPAHIQSFILTRDLGDIVSLETLCADWASVPPEVTLKRSLITRVAHISKKMHDIGLFHRDFYLCHLCLQSNDADLQDAPLYLLDLHRAILSSTIPETHRHKDLAALYFSALHIGLSKRDVMRFIRQYFQCKLTSTLLNSPQLLAIEARALKLDKKFQRKMAAGTLQ